MFTCHSSHGSELSLSDCVDRNSENFLQLRVHERSRIPHFKWYIPHDTEFDFDAIPPSEKWILRVKISEFVNECDENKRLTVSINPLKSFKEFCHTVCGNGTKVIDFVTNTENSATIVYKYLKSGLKVSLSLIKCRENASHLCRTPKLFDEMPRFRAKSTNGKRLADCEKYIQSL
jgi:hypothetical protein